MASLIGLGVCAWGWYRSANDRVRPERLRPEERLALVQDLVDVSPGIYRWTWFEPDIGYTLRPKARLEALGDTFESNDLGYRSGLSTKRPGTYRIVFLGDSWTYGMGVPEENSFPKVFERFANRYSGWSRPIEAWTLALPGYNTFNYLSAFWFFFERLEPDAVVICPSGNDNHSTLTVLPNGSLSRRGLWQDRFGDPHVVIYPTRRLDSYRFRERWRMSFDEIHDTEERLRSLEIPVLLFFLARWEPVDVHARVSASSLRSPYLIAPLELTIGRWENPPPYGHGTPEANRHYALMVYHGMAELLGWPSLPGEPVEASVFEGPPTSEDWLAMHDRLSSEMTAANIPEFFRPSSDARIQVAGPSDPETGLMGRATTILVRFRPAARFLRVAVRRLADAPSIYPLNLTVSIPSPSGGTRLLTTITADGPEVHRFSVPIPQDLRVGSALDVVFIAARTAAAPQVLAGRSLYIESIENAVEP